MTTKVTIEACCAEDEAVKIIIGDKLVSDTYVLQNGDTETYYIHGEVSLLVKEFKTD